MSLGQHGTYLLLGQPYIGVHMYQYMLLCQPVYMAVRVTGTCHIFY